jgi:hypothetical protein
MHSISLIISAIVDNRPNLQFIRANADLLNRHSVLFNQLESPLEKEELLTNLWNTEYNAQLIKDTNKYTGVKFHNASALSMFLLEWS